MAKPHKPGGRRLDADDVIAGRGKPPAARELIELIRAENPTGLDLHAKETARRYGRKARLQSLLIDLFADDLEVVPDPREPGVVGILYRPLDMHACHVPLQALDDDARSWAQGEVDRMAFDKAHPPAGTLLGKRGGEGPRRPVAPDGEASPDRDRSEASVVEQVRLGQEAIDAYDYELARTHLAHALTLASGDVEAALPLLALLVDHLAADDEALGVEAHLSPAARRHPEARLLLGLAAARAGQRERAKALLEGHRGARSVEPFLVLARAALASGDVDAVAHDLAAVRERDPIHPHLRDLEGALAARRAQERLPLEDALTGLLEGGHVDAAEPRARALLARFPDSEVGRRALRAVDELRKATQIRQLLAEAEEAAARAELALALSLLGQALAAGPRGEQLALILARMDEIKATLRDRDEQAQVEKAVALLGASDRLAGLLAYLDLGELQRRRVRARVELPHLAWLAEVASSERPRAAALAVIALERACALVAEAPQAALDRLEEHARALQGVARRAEIEDEARGRLDVLRREAAARRMEEARICFEDGAVERADALLAPELLGDLDEEGRARGEALRARIAHAQERRLLIATFEQRRRDGALLQARDAADALLARGGEPERARWVALRDELGTELREAFRVRIDPTCRPVTSLRNVNLLPFRGAPYLLTAGGLTVPFVQTCGAWVFVRMIDLTARIERKRYLLRAPAPIDLMSVDVDGDRLVVLDRLGAALEIGLAGGEILGWYDSYASERTGPGPERPHPEGALDFTVHSQVIENAAIVPGTRLLWQVVFYGALERRFVRIVDLGRRRVVRELRDSPGRVHLDPLMAREEPLMAAVHLEEDFVVFHDVRGVPLRSSKLDVAAIPGCVVADPSSERIVIFTGRKGTTENGRTPIQWCTFTPGAGASPEQRIEELGEVDCMAAADPASGLVYFESRPGGDHGGPNELRAFRLSGAPSPAAGTDLGAEAQLPALEEVFRAVTPPRTQMIQGNQRAPLAIFVPHEDDFEATALGPEPPSFRPQPRAGWINFRKGNGLLASCYKPTGARKAAGAALLTAIQHEPRAAWTRRFSLIQHEGDPLRMLDLDQAYEHLGELGLASALGNLAFQKFPDHPEVRVRHARPLANMARWSEVRDLLAPVDPRGLDDGTAQHLHHELGRALLNLGEPEEARRILERGASYPGGCCDLTALLALATPLSEGSAAEERAWTPEQLAVRELVAAVETADACLAQGDAAGAILALDRLVVTETSEVQSLARRAEAELRIEATEEALFDRACTLAWFCAANAEKKPFLRRELPIPRGRWDMAKLDELAARANRWLDATLGEAWPQPAGGL